MENLLSKDLPSPWRRTFLAHTAHTHASHLQQSTRVFAFRQQVTISAQPELTLSSSSSYHKSSGTWDQLVTNRHMLSHQQVTICSCPALPGLTSLSSSAYLKSSPTWDQLVTNRHVLPTSRSQSSATQPSLNSCPCCHRATSLFPDLWIPVLSESTAAEWPCLS